MRVVHGLLASFLVFALVGCSGEDEDPACSQGMERCGDSCVDRLADSEHCGGCGIACGEGETCVDGSCEVACEEGERRCAGACVDTQRDPNHCGACGVTCGEGELCSNGACKAECDDGLLACDGSCVDTSQDDRHCGSCGSECADGFTCVDGKCGCGEGKALCGPDCVDVETDAQNCGACAHACEGNEICSDGICTCPLDGLICGEVCVDPDSDSEHCGACDQACGDGEVCSGGACACAPDRLECDGLCVDTQNSDLHCGACNRSCVDQPNSDDGFCREGECVFDCHSGFLDCDGDPTNGCETDTLDAAEHCGACNRNCSAFQNVASGSCDFGDCVLTCQDGWLDCDGDAESGCETNPLESLAHCGACNNDCLAGENQMGAVCDQGVCVLTCVDGWDDCDGDPANGCESFLDTDTENCGACGNACAAACDGGTCTDVASIPERFGSFGAVVMSDGTGYAWGANGTGQLGDGTQIEKLRPTRVDALSPLRALAGGYLHGCGVHTDGKASCWGMSLFGQTGRGVTSPLPLLDHGYVVTDDGLLEGVVEIGMGDFTTCAHLEDGRVACWGPNYDGRLGIGQEDVNTPSPTAQYVRDPDDPSKHLTGMTSFAAGEHHFCAAGPSGAYCWGVNHSGQIGKGFIDPPDSPRDDHNKLPVPVVGLLGPVQEIVAGGAKSCAVIEGSGKVQCWGQNTNGFLGVGEEEAAILSPTEVPGLSGVVTMSISTSHACAVLADKTMRCWGSNSHFQLADGSNENRTSPVTAQWPGGAPMDGIEKVAVGVNSTCVLRTGGELLCWGQNSTGQLGVGDKNDREVPVRPAW